ncbi:MAG: type II toxin-antitoxin system VapC family toxin [Thermoplasmataceae archaeon]
MRGSVLKYLMDASSFFKLLLSPKIDGQNLLENSSITDLTIFEIGNVLWKRKDSNIKDMPAERIIALSKVIGNITRDVTTFPITSIEIPAILTVAMNVKTTFYDASYIYMCHREKLSLISEDVELRKKAVKEKVSAFALVELFP